MFDDEFMNDMLLNPDAYGTGDNNDIDNNEETDYQTGNVSSNNTHYYGGSGCCIALLPIILIIALVIFS